MGTTNRKPRITSFASPFSTRHWDENRARISLLIMKIVTGDMLPLSFVELMAFVEPEDKPPSWQTTARRVE